MEKAKGKEYIKDWVAVIGDSTFMHTGVNSLMNMFYNQGTGTVLILDNSTTGMTGHQDHAATGKTLRGEIVPAIDLYKLCHDGIGIENTRIVNAFDTKELEKALKEELAKDAVSVIIVQAPCALLKSNKPKPAFHIDTDKCKRCYMCMKPACPAITKADDGTFTYSNMEDLIEVCVKNMTSEEFPEEQVRAYLTEMLPTLDYWKRYEELSDDGQFETFKKRLIDEINALHVEGMPRVEKLNALVGKYVNLEYRLPGGAKVKFLDDQTTYLGNQLESTFGGDRCFGVLANMDFILICTYEAEGANPELLLYKKR